MGAFKIFEFSSILTCTINIIMALQGKVTNYKKKEKKKEMPLTSDLDDNMT